MILHIMCALLQIFFKYSFSQDQCRRKTEPSKDFNRFFPVNLRGKRKTICVAGVFWVRCLICLLSFLGYLSAQDYDICTNVPSKESQTQVQTVLDFAESSYICMQ